MTAEQMVQYAYEEGFSAAAVVDTADIVFDPSFRPYCEENLCGQYGANYSCPPDCGTPEEMKQKVLAHKKALVLQSIWQLESYSLENVCRYTFKFTPALHNAESDALTCGLLFREICRERIGSLKAALACE